MNPVVVVVAVIAVILVIIIAAVIIRKRNKYKTAETLLLKDIYRRSIKINRKGEHCYFMVAMLSFFALRFPNYQQGTAQKRIQYENIFHHEL